MKVLVFGATGMIGSGVLKECLQDDRVTAVLAVGRSSCGVTHDKLREIIHRDLFEYVTIKEELRGYDACFFCLGVSALGKSEEEYRRLTYDLTLAAAQALLELNPEMTFCYVSGEGADSTEQGRVMWARVKGKIENELTRMPFKAALMFRPAYIQPVKGVRSRTPHYRAPYAVFAPLYPILRRFFPKYVTTTESIGRAMIRAAEDGQSNRVLASSDINALAASGGQP
ncbi:MAG: NAD-dependent epimerase/dehydratase family protein [Gemmatimonadetes bacterium]|nr:NAD-dependent epimerase/dehydratase family protein [Gemmatimonadota bacterium]